jgi:acetyltransferase
MTEPLPTARDLAPYADLSGKPLLTAWMGGESVSRGVETLNSAGIATFSYPDEAARAFALMWRYSANLEALYETPPLSPAAQSGSSDARATAETIISQALEAGRELLTEDEAKRLLAAYDIPTVPTRVALDEESAVRDAREIGFPIVLKLFSYTITHKTDVGGVKLNLKDEAAVREAFRAIQSGVSAQDFDGVTVQPMIKLDGYEIIIGSSLDAQFGPVLLFGTGGQLVEVFKDRALALPPLSTTLARRLMAGTKIYEALQGVRGREPVALAALEAILVRFSQLVTELPRIKEIDINPLLASPERLLALDARVVLHPASVADADLPHPAIRPYPAQYASETQLKNGTAISIRPIRPEDEPLLRQFHETLSETSVYGRYLQPLGLGARVAHERLRRVCLGDYDREIALVAQSRAADGPPQIVGVGRLSKVCGAGDENTGRFALLISDAVQKQGLGTELLRQLVEVARAEGLTRLSASTLPDNNGIQATCRKLGFEVVTTADGRVELSLGL